MFVTSRHQCPLKDAMIAQQGGRDQSWPVSHRIECAPCRWRVMLPIAGEDNSVTVTHGNGGFGGGGSLGRMFGGASGTRTDPMPGFIGISKHLAEHIPILSTSTRRTSCS